MATGNTQDGTNSIIWNAAKILMSILAAIGAIYAAFNYPNEIKLVVLGIVALFWILLEATSLKTIMTPAIRLGLGGLFLLFIAGWVYGKLNEPPTVAETIYYMVVLDASDAMNEPFDMYPSKWVAVREAFQKFYDRSHPDSNYGLVLIGGQNTKEGSATPCSLPTVPLIPVVSENGDMLPHKELTLQNLRNQIEGQQPQGGASLNRAFFLAKNHLDTRSVDEPVSSMVIVLIANASDKCVGKIDWDTLASNIELSNEKIAIRKELILLDVEATQEVTAFAEQINAKGDPNMIVQVVQTYYQLEMSILFVIERNEADVIALEAEATAKAQIETDQVYIPVTGATPIILASRLPKTPKVIVAKSATSIPTETLTPTLTPTFTSTFTSTSTFTPTPTMSITPTPSPSNIPFVIWTTTKPSSGGGGSGGGGGYDNNGDGRVTCSDFTTESEALAALNAGYTNLDSDGDGVPCESLPP